MRQHSNSYFEKAFHGLDLTESAAPSRFVDQVARRYAPQRRFRRNRKAWQATLTREARIQSCLLEYGEKITGKSNYIAPLDMGEEGSDEEGGEGKKEGKEGKKGKHAKSGSAFEKELSKMQKKLTKEAEAESKEAVALQQQMMQQMSATDGSAAGVSGRQVVS